MAIQHLSGAEAKKHLNEQKLILSVGADWCGPCKMMAPQLEALSEQVPVIKVSADDNKDFVMEMKVTGLPTTFIYENGKIKETFVGFVPKEQIEKKL